MAIYPKLFVVLMVITFSTTFAQKSERQQVYSYQKCQTDRDCKDHSFCFGNDDDKTGVCKCLAGFELFRNQTFYDCVKGINLGEACTTDLECRVGNPFAICNRLNLCECDEDSVQYENGKCYEARKIGDLCNKDTDCIFTSTSRGSCTLGHCGCRYSDVPSNDQTHCINLKKLGAPCTEDEECSLATNFTRCLDNCQCNTDYILARRGNRCIKAALKFDEDCEYDGQCSKFLYNSICDSNKCTCNPGFHGYGTKCLLTKHVGEPCDDDGNCLSEKKLYGNVKCGNGLCECIFGKGSDGQCSLQKKIEEPSSSNNNKSVGLDTMAHLLIFILLQLYIVNYA